MLSSSAAEIATIIVALNQLLDAVQRFREGCSPSVSVDHLIHWRPGVLCLHPKDVLHVEVWTVLSDSVSTSMSTFPFQILKANMKKTKPVVLYMF